MQRRRGASIQSRSSIILLLHNCSFFFLFHFVSRKKAAALLTLSHFVSFVGFFLFLFFRCFLLFFVVFCCCCFFFLTRHLLFSICLGETYAGPLDLGASRADFGDSLRERERQRQTHESWPRAGFAADADPTRGHGKFPRCRGEPLGEELPEET
jgi:hypothetical protein